MGRRRVVVATVGVALLGVLAAAVALGSSTRETETATPAIGVAVPGSEGGFAADPPCPIAGPDGAGRTDRGRSADDARSSPPRRASSPG